MAKRDRKYLYDYVIVRATDQLVLGFRSGDTPKQAINFFMFAYLKKFSGPIPDLTTIERSAFDPKAIIKPGQTYVYNIPRAT